MRLYIDPTEARADTRVPQDVLGRAELLSDLEKVTGADFMITPLEWKGAMDSMPGRLRLRQHLRSGAILIQRKSGGDFVSSVPDLKAIQDRMLEHCYTDDLALPGRCWLLTSSVEVREVNDVLMVVPRGSDAHGILYEAAEAALLMWGLRGGNVDSIADDSHMGRWVDRMLNAVQKCADNPVREYSSWEALQRLVLEPVNWITTGSAFPPGIGRKKLEQIAQMLGGDKHSPPPLFEILKLLTAGRVVDAKGWGKKSQESLLDWWGLPADGSRYLADQPRFNWITFKFDKPLPFGLEGDGVEKIDDITYKFTDYESLSACALMLGVFKEMDAGISPMVQDLRSGKRQMTLDSFKDAIAETLDK